MSNANWNKMQSLCQAFRLDSGRADHLADITYTSRWLGNQYRDRRRAGPEFYER
ncbi:hypothetical protein LOC67_05805 [Stieleria sp. JC731]|uniref:hypothetical protein n=1 Tax=Pirellulaceae TaxID=2691357 RepID=UPI001E5167DB|nr:hypothetical protein [Stieleria sp. JC731]MCC9600068.1 hypothetical protein [Stieleria sp. JC731]